MLASFYGQFQLVIKSAGMEMTNLKEFVEKKPQLAEQALGKVETTVQKLIEKGMARHSLVQAIVCDYVRAQADVGKVKFLADCMKEKMPTLLASKQGLEVACALFNLLDAKDRKIVVKSLAEPLKEMSTNRIAALFITHVLNTLDDTVISKKKILHDLLISVDEGIEARCFQSIFIGIAQPRSKRTFDAEDLAAFTALQEHSTSKKAADVRRQELMQAVCHPLENFFYEKLHYHLEDVTKVPLLKEVLAMRIELGGVPDSELHEELIR